MLSNYDLVDYLNSKNPKIDRYDVFEHDEKLLLDAVINPEKDKNSQAKYVPHKI